MEENNLINKCKKGDIDAFESLIENYKVYLYNIAIAILKDEDDVGDAISETILNVYKHIRKLKNNSLFKTWITRILINESKKIMKKRKHNTNLEEIEEKISNHESDNDQKIDTINAVNSLKKESRDVIILFYYNELKISEISKILQIPEGTVKSRMNTAKKELYRILNSKEEM